LFDPGEMDQAIARYGPLQQLQGPRGG